MNRSEFGAVYEEHAGRISGYLSRLVHDPVAAEDLTSQTFLQAWAAAERYEERGKPAVRWLLRIARHVGVDYLRGQRPHVEVTEDLVDGTLMHDPEAAALRRCDNEHVRWAVFGLREDQRHVVELRFFGGRSVPETAAVLAKSEGAVRIAQHRALRQLRTVLG